MIILLAGLVYALIEGPGSGWTSAKILACFAVAALALVGLALYEPRRDEPLIDLRFFRSAPFSGAVAIAICAFAALGGFLLVNTLYLQDVRGYTPLLAGVYTLPMAAMTAICSPLSGRLVGSRGTRPSLIVAGLGHHRGRPDPDAGHNRHRRVVLISSYVLFGIGFGMVNAPITNSTVSGMPRSQAGVAAGVASTSRQVGSSLGVAVIGSATISALHGPFKLDFANASHAGWWIVTGCGVAVLCLGLLVSGSWARETARRTASRLMPAGGSMIAGTTVGRPVGRGRPARHRPVRRRPGGRHRPECRPAQPGTGSPARVGGPARPARRSRRAAGHVRVPVQPAVLGDVDISANTAPWSSLTTAIRP